jgi:hypothetical protein
MNKQKDRNEKNDKNELLGRIAALPGDWHGAGCLSGNVIEAIYDYTTRGKCDFSLETGVGKSTLILSHTSKSHFAFAADFGGSLKKTKESDLLNPGVVTFVEGRCQQTVPQFIFEQAIDFALIDGAHAYPFPELDYYYIYPHLREGSIMVVDDIHIPTIHNFFRFLKEDAMFSLDRVVDTTAFFRRSSAPTFDPLGDGWLHQGYNKRFFPVPITDSKGKFVSYTSPDAPKPF